MRLFRNQLLFSLLIFALILTLAGCGENEEENEIIEASRAAYIINGSAGTISVFDMEKLEVKNDILTVGKYPADIKILADKIYVVNTGDNNVQIIGLETLTNVGVIDTGNGTLPEKIDFIGDSKAYIPCNGDKSVKVVDLTARQVTKSIEVGVAPWGVAIAGEKVYVCNTNAVYDADTKAMTYSKATVSVIDSATDKLIKDIGVETNPTEIATSGDLVIVQCTGNYADITGKLCIIDTKSDTVIKTIDLGTTPSNVAVAPGGKVYVTTFGGLLRVDINSGAVGAPLTDFSGGAGMAFDRDGKCYICVPDWTGGGNDKLLVMDESEKLMGTYKPGGGASIIALKE